MPEIAVKSLDNRAVGKVDLPEEVFSYPYKEHLIHLAVVALRAAQRAGTHKVKGRHEVRGSGVKPYRQKGTGRSRAGSRRSPLRRGGGVVHGPHPRSHGNQLSRNEKRNALQSALSRKLLAAKIMVIDSLELESHKTGAFAARLQDLGVDAAARPTERERVMGRGERRRRVGECWGRTLSTDKASGLRDGSNIIAFVGDSRANKIEVRKAVETQFAGVRVAEVRIANVHGKVRRRGRFVGRTPDWKKAYVRLAEGQIDLFDNV